MSYCWAMSVTARDILEYTCRNSMFWSSAKPLFFCSILQKLCLNNAAAAVRNIMVTWWQLLLFFVLFFLQLGIHELGVRKAILGVVQERLRFDVKAKEKEREIEKPEVHNTLSILWFSHYCQVCSEFSACRSRLPASPPHGDISLNTAQ